MVQMQKEGDFKDFAAQLVQERISATGRAIKAPPRDMFAETDAAGPAAQALVNQPWPKHGDQVFRRRHRRNFCMTIHWDVGALERQLRTSGQMFEAAFHAAAIGKAIVSVTGHIVEANESFAHMLGYSP